MIGSKKEKKFWCKMNPFSYLKKKYDDYIIPRRFLKFFKNHVQECYRLGYSTDEIETGFREAFPTYLKPETLNSEEHKMMVRNLRRLILAYHPTKPVNFESLP